MKQTILTLLILLILPSAGYAKRTVTEKYCNKLSQESLQELQQQVKNGTMSSEKAELVLKIIETSCNAASQSQVSIADYEALFEPVEAKECNKEEIIQQVKEAMPDYAEDDIIYVANALTLRCQQAVLNGDSNLTMMLSTKEYLKELGIDHLFF